jgi:hypothetical protein
MEKLTRRQGGSFVAGGNEFEAAIATYFYFPRPSASGAWEGQRQV